jgi:hypothetical protein
MYLTSPQQYGCGRPVIDGSCKVRKNMNKVYWALLCALVSGSLLSVSCPAFAETAPKATDPCFKPAFDKRAGAGRWFARECAGDAVQYFQVEFRDEKQQPYRASFSDGDSESIANSSYQLVAPDILAVDLAAERGGRIFLLHRLGASRELFVLRVEYMTRDEVSLAMTRTGNTIRLNTGLDTINVTVNPDGSLSKVRRAAPKATEGRR